MVATYVPGPHGPMVFSSTAGGAWTPASVSPLFWYDASNAGSLTLDGSNNVLQWNDLSGHARHLTPAASSGNIPYTTSVQNGLSGVSFTVALNLELVTSSFSISQPFTFIAAIKTGGSALASFAALFDDAGHSGARAVLALKRNDQSNDPAIYAGSAVTPISGTPLSTSTAYRVYGRYNGASSSGGVNGVDSGSISPGTSAISNGISIGGVVADGNSASGSFALELFGYSGVSSTDLSNANSYLSSKWAI